MKTVAAVGFALWVGACIARAEEPKEKAGSEQQAAAQQPAKPPPAADKVPDRAELEKRFAETMSGATLVGHYTAGDGEPKEDKYTIAKVTKRQGDYWLFQARIQFGGRDLTVPILLPVKWAGDTAVITVTDVGIPGLGTYTARVLIYGDQYAGTWSGTNHGGHLWGRIERADDKQDAAPGATEPENRREEKGKP